MLNVARLQGGGHTIDATSPSSAGDELLDEWTASPLYVLKSAKARLKLPQTSVSLVSNAATTPIGVEIVMRQAELTVDTFPSGMLHPKNLDAGGASPGHAQSPYVRSWQRAAS